MERDSVSVMEVWSECFRKTPADKKRTDSDDIIRILVQLGWEQKGTRRTGCYGTQKGFKRCKPAGDFVN